MRLGIKREDAFEFDDYFKSRSESELNKRMASLLKVIKAEIDYEAKKVEYRKEEERTLARLGMNGHFKNLTGESSKAIEEEISGTEGDASEIEVVDTVGTSNGHTKKAKAGAGKALVSSRGKITAGQEAKKAQTATSTSNLTKRKPEISEKDSPEKDSSAEKSASKQQTLSSFFAGSSQPKP